MASYYQPFDGGPSGQAITQANSATYGAAIDTWTDAAGTALYSVDTPIRGTTSARVSTPSGTVTSTMICALEASVTAVRAHVYTRVPTGLPTKYQALHVRSSRDVHVCVFGDGSLSLESWGELIGSTAPAGTLPAAGTSIRVSIGVTSGGSASAAVYLAHNTTPLWETSGPSGTTGSITQVQTGIPWTSTSATALTVDVDDFRIETGVATPLLPPEVVEAGTTQAPLNTNLVSAFQAVGADVKSLRQAIDGKVVKLTQAEYNALAVKQSTTLYVIVG